eukprot:g3076.t1
MGRWFNVLNNAKLILQHEKDYAMRIGEDLSYTGPYGGDKNVRNISNVFLTGGSGYLGRNLIRFFVENGVRVHAIVRSETSEKTVASLGATPFRADLNDVEGMRKAAEGCDTLVHSAAYVKMFGDIRLARQVTVDGTRNVMKVAKDAGIRRAIHVGTEAGCLNARAGPLHNLTEETPLPDRPFGGIYSTTKNEAERVALSFHHDDNFEVVVVRPRLIWGRDDSVVLPGLVHAAKSGLLQWFDGGTYFTSTCHVDNVVEGIVRAATAPVDVVGGESFFLTDGDPVEFKWFVSNMLRAVGAPVPSDDRTIPLKFVWAAAAVAEAACDAANFLLSSVLTWRCEPFVARQSLALVGQEITVDDSKAVFRMGYRRTTSIAEGIEELRRRHGYSPREDDGSGIKKEL